MFYFYKVVKRRLHDETETAPNADATPKPIPLADPGYISFMNMKRTQ